MKLFDATIFLGSDCNHSPFQHSDIQKIQKMLDKYRIQKALLLSFASFWLNFIYGNEAAFTASEKDERIIACPVAVPNSASEIGDEERFVQRLIGRGARCVGFFPKSFNIALDKRVIGNLFKAIQKYRLPVIILREEADLQAIAALASDYPQIPFICSSPDYRNRNLYPILLDVKNIYITIGAPFAANYGIEELTRRIGSNRLLFASNYPISEPGAAIGYLFYSEIDDRDLEDIAFNNMDCLVQGVKHEEA